jgi:DNA invertase Pin-like site-specific DNA recombinase
MNEKQAKINEELKTLIENKGGQMIDKFQNALKQIKIVCKNKHQFSYRSTDLEKGKWCEDCNKNSIPIQVTSVLDDLCLNFEINHKPKNSLNLIYDIKLNDDDKNVFLEYDTDDIFQDEKNITNEIKIKRNNIKDKVIYALKNNYKIVRINYKDIEDKDALLEFISDIYENNNQIQLSDDELYSWLNVDDLLKLYSSPVNSPQLVVQNIKHVEIPIKNTQPIIENIKSNIINHVKNYEHIKSNIEPVFNIQSNSDLETKQDVFNIHSSQLDVNQPVLNIIKIEEPVVIPKDHKAVLIYTRVSTTMQVDQFSLEAQLANIEKYVSDKKMTIKKVYSDRGISGREMKNRPELLKMLDDLQSGECIIVYSMSRLGRDTGQIFSMIELIKKKRASLIIWEQNIEIDATRGDAMANAFITMLSMFAQLESDQTSQRVSSVMNYMSGEGLLRSKPKFGYKFVGKKKPFEIDEDEQRIISRIREIRIENPKITFTRIGEQLLKEGLNPKKAKKFYPNRIKIIMQENNIA